MAIAEDKIIAKRIKERSRHAHFSGLPAYELQGLSFGLPVGLDLNIPLAGYPLFGELDQVVDPEETGLPQVPEPFPM